VNTKEGEKHRNGFSKTARERVARYRNCKQN